MVKQGKSQVTLRRIASVASVCFRLRWLFVAIGGVASIWFGWSVVAGNSDSPQALVPLTVLLWALVVLGAGFTLPTLPPPIADSDRFGTRVKKRIWFGAYLATAIFVVGLLGFAAWMSLRAFGLTTG